MRLYRCAVANCGGRRETDRLHSFPRNVDRAQLWKNFSSNSSLDGIPLKLLFNKACICDRHFVTSEYQTEERIRLNRNAIPTLLPPSSLPSTSSFQLPPIPTSLPISSLPDSPHFLGTSSDLVSSMPSTSRPHRLSDNISPLPTSSCIVGGGASGVVTSSPIHVPMQEDEGHSLCMDVNVSPVLMSSRVVGDTETSEELTSSQILHTTRKGARRSILHDIGMTRVEQLTPRKKVMFNMMTNQRRQIKRLKTVGKQLKCISFPDIVSDRVINALEKNLSPSATTLIKSMLREGQRKPKGRRWTRAEKIISLFLFKKSPKSYASLRSFIPLPSKKTLTSLLSHLPFSTGINPAIFHFLSESVKGMGEADRYSVLMFDEMSITPDLVFNGKLDRIVGYVDHGSRGTSKQIARQALVFMVRGLWGRWKQPVSYYFSHGGTPSNMLKEAIEENLHSLKSAGLNIVATVCDMGTNNVKALQLMGASFTDPSFEFEGQTVVTVFDPPHLLKCFRNLFLKYDIVVPYMLGGNEVELRGTWEHIRQLYQEEKNNIFGRLTKLTKVHMDPKGFDKMKVSLAAQVFSHHVACLLGNLISLGVIGSAGIATGEVCTSLNGLFDALNGDKKDRSKKKPPMTDDSHHAALFLKMVEYLGKWKFVGQKGLVRPPSQKGWLATLRAVLNLWDTLRLRFDHLNTRSLNQDPIENLFSVVRQNCGSNRNPNAGQFVSALKTTIITGLVNSSGKGNCEGDDCSLLSTLNKFLDVDTGSSCNLLQEKSALGNIQMRQKTYPLKEVQLPSSHIQFVASVATRIAEMALRGNTCKECLSCLISVDPHPCNVHAILLSDNPHELTSPTEEFVGFVFKCLVTLDEVLSEISHESNILLKLVDVLRPLEIEFINCSIHGRELVHKLVMAICQVSIDLYCKKVNGET